MLAQLTAGSDQLDIVAAGGDGYLHAWTPAGAARAGLAGEGGPAGRLHPEVGLRARGRPAPGGHPHGGLAERARRGRPAADIVERSQYTEITGRGRPAAPLLLPLRLRRRRPAAAELAGDRPRLRRVLRLGPGRHHRGVQLHRWRPTSPATARTSSPTARCGPRRWRSTAQGQRWATYGNAGGAWTTLLSTHGLLGDTVQRPHRPPALGRLHLVAAPSARWGGSWSTPSPRSARPASAACQHPNAELPITDVRVGLPGRRRRRRGRRRHRRLPRAAPGPRLPDLADHRRGHRPRPGASVIEGGDSSAITAVTAAGAEAPGFPKFTSGWDLYAPERRRPRCPTGTPTW